jgi:hypothetical protein
LVVVAFQRSEATRTLSATLVAPAPSTAAIAASYPTSERRCRDRPSPSVVTVKPFDSIRASRSKAF